MANLWFLLRILLNLIKAPKVTCLWGQDMNLSSISAIFDDIENFQEESDRRCKKVLSAKIRKDTSAGKLT